MGNATGTIFRYRTSALQRLWDMCMQFRGRKLGDVRRACSIEQSGEDCTSFRFVSDHSRRYDSKESIKQYLNCIVMALVAFASFLSQTKPIAHSECVVTLHFFLRAIGLAGHGITAKTSAMFLHFCRCLSAPSSRSDCFGLTQSETEYWLPFPTRFRGSRGGLEGHTGR